MTRGFFAHQLIRNRFALFGLMRLPRNAADLARGDHRLRAALDPELGQNRRDMRLHRRL